MASPFVVAAIGVAAAGFCSVAGRQFRAYGTGQPSYASRLEGRRGLAAIVMAIASVVSSAVLTFLTDGSATTFWTILAGFAVFSVAISWWR